MTLVERIIEHLRLREGERLWVYLDHLGNPTVGVGHLVMPNDKLKVGDRITKARSEKFLVNDMQLALNAARDQAKKIGIETDDFILALTSVNFQLGVGWPKVFHTSFPKLVAGDWQGAIRGFEDSVWAEQTPVRVNDFVKAIEKAYNKPTELKTPIIFKGETTCSQDGKPSSFHCLSLLWERLKRLISRSS